MKEEHNIKGIMDIKKLDKGLSLRYFGEINENILKKCIKNKFDCIELAFLLSYYKETDFANNAEKYVSMIRNSKIKPWSIHLPYGKEVDISSINKKDREYGIEFNIKLLEAAKSIGVKTAVLHPSAEPVTEENRSQQIENARESIKYLGKVAQNLGINLAIENLPRTCLGNTSKELIDIIKDIPNVGICFDTNHSLKEDNIEFLNNILNNDIKIFTLHISDYDFVNERHRLPGDGINDWNKIIDILEKSNYTGPIMYEINRQPFERDIILLEDIRKNQELLVNKEIMKTPEV